ncbi:MAG: PQQ-binding-like beta-propeller repeat protein [Pirellulaceae bacterium]|nr:PQQ-binding-like beta-propeller repeat protein [Pirellulaceae bacterium]
MTPNELINTIEKSGLVDARILAKIKKELDNPARPVKAKAIIKFLVDRGELTTDQGQQFLDGSWQAPRVLAQQPELVVNQQGAAPDYDTDDLTNLAPAVAVPIPQHASPARQRQNPDNATMVYDVDDAMEESGEIEVPVVVQATEMYQPLDDAMGFDAPASPLGSVLDSAPEERGTQLTRPAFTGKREKIDQWQTKWVYIGSSLLAVLLVIGAVLALSVFRAPPEKLYEAAESSYLAGNYIDAANRIREFYENYPSHERANTARVREVQCYLANAFSMKNYNEVATLAKEKIPTIENNPSYSIIQDDFVVWFPITAFETSQAGLKETTIEGMQAALKRAEENGEILTFLTSSQRNSETAKPNIERFENNVKLIRGRIDKEIEYEKALQEINQFATQSKPDEAFAIFNRLTRIYGDLGARVPLREAMTRVTASEMNLIVPSPIQVDTSTTDVTPLATSHVQLVSKYGTPTSSLRDELLPYLIEGYLYVVSAGDGEVVWSRFLGYETMLRPMWVDAASKAELLAFDERTHDLMKFDARTGELRWRARIGESFVEPTVYSDAVYVPTRSGSVLKIDLFSGEMVAGIKLPKPISVPIASSDQESFLYVVADNSNIYIVSAVDLKCQEIYYLGHLPNQIRIPPIYWSGHLLVDVNAQNSELYVFRFTQRGLGLELLQNVRLTSGPITIPPSRLGRNMLFVSDTGELRLIELTTAEERTPISIAATEKIETRGASRAFVLAQGSGLWIASRGLAVFNVDKIKGQFRRETIVEGDDAFLGPLVRYEDVLIHARRRSGSRQISVSAVNVADMKMLWRSDFGAGLAGAPFANQRELFAVSSQGDMFALENQTSGFSSLKQKLSASDIDLPLNFSDLVGLGGNKFAALSRMAPDFLLVDLGERLLRLTRMQAPADRMANEPRSLSQDFIFPSLSGLILRIDENGRGVGAPFQPPLSPGEEVRWNRAGVNQDDMILVGDEKQTVFLLDARVRGSLSLAGQTAIDGQAITGFAGDKDFGFVFSEATGRVALQKIPYRSPLAVSGSVPVEARPIYGPAAVSGKVIAHLDNGKLCAWNENLELVWSIPISNEKIAAVISAGSSADVLVVFESGRVVRVDSGGQVAATVELGQPVRHAPLLHNDQYYFSTNNGSVLVVDRSKL